MCRLYYVVFTAAMVMVVGCGGPSHVEQKNKPIGAPNNGGKNASAVSLPKDFPLDVPTYPASKVAGVLDGQEGWLLYLETEATLDEATKFYKKQLAENGWTHVGAVETPVSTTITATKDARNLVIGVSIENDTTTISMNVPR